MGANEKAEAAYHGAPQYGERVEGAVDPRPPLSLDDLLKPSEYEVGEKEDAGPSPKQHQPRHKAGRGANLVAGVVSAVLLGPFVLLLWHWALGVVL